MARDTLAQADAIGKSQAVIEFDMDGTIVVAKRRVRLSRCGPGSRERAGHVGILG